MKQAYSDLQTLEELIAFTTARLPSWGWLLRNHRGDGEPSHFCNITSPEFQMRYVLRGGRVVDHHAGQRYPAYAATPVEAFKASLDQIDPIFFELDENLADDFDEDAYQLAQRRAEDNESDRLFDEDMKEDRERHTFREGDDFFMVWLHLFEDDPVNVRANFFELEADGTWKCQLIDDRKCYAQARGFPTREALKACLAEWTVPIGADV